MILEILSPQNQLFTGNIQQVDVPGKNGKFQVLPHHAPIISTLSKGTIRVIRKSGKESFFEVEGGIIEVKENKVIILANPGWE